MSALAPPRTYLINAAPVTALDRAQEGTLHYFSPDHSDLPQTPLRRLTALDAMYAYFGSDEDQA